MNELVREIEKSYTRSGEHNVTTQYKAAFNDLGEKFDLLLKQIAQLTKERDELNTQLMAWNSVFGTSQLTHASVRLESIEKKCEMLEDEVQNWTDSAHSILKRAEAAEKERDELAAQLKEQSSHIRCIYCNAKYTAEQSGELADHILSCEKSPLVQMVRTMESRIWYIVEFPKGYVSQTYFYDLINAQQWVENVYKKHAIQGKVIKVRECQ